MLDDRREDFYNSHFASCVAGDPAFDESSSRLLLELVLTCDVLNQIVARYLSEFGISKSAYNVLTLLRAGPPEGMQLHDLGELLVVSRANITGLIDHLEQKGYVTREVPPSDRRVRQARITPEAEALLNRVTPTHHKNLSRLVSDVGEQDKQALRDLLTEVRQSLRTHAAECIREPLNGANESTGSALSIEQEARAK